MSVSKEDRLRGEKLRGTSDQVAIQRNIMIYGLHTWQDLLTINSLSSWSQEKTYSLFGTKRTVMLPSERYICTSTLLTAAFSFSCWHWRLTSFFDIRSQDQKKEKFGIPIMFVVVPSVSFTLWAYYHVLTTAIAFFTAFLAVSHPMQSRQPSLVFSVEHTPDTIRTYSSQAGFLQSWKPVQICSAVTFSQFLNFYATCLGVLTGSLSVLAGIGTIAEAVIMTIADGFAFVLATIFVPLISISAETFSRTSFRSASMQKWMAKLVSTAITLLPADSLQAQKLSSLDINGDVGRKAIPEVAFVTSSLNKDKMTTLKGNLLLIERSQPFLNVLPTCLE